MGTPVVRYDDANPWGFLMRIIATCLAMLLLSACGPKTSQVVEPAPSVTHQRLTDGPVSLTIDQRGAGIVPQFDTKVLIALGDISRGKVLVTVKVNNDSILAGPTTMREGESLLFTFEGVDYAAELVDMERELIGTDRATFRVRLAIGARLNETQKIEKLIDSLESLQGATFIRNDESHTAAEAADHLRSKWKWAGNRITTAEQFIDQLATRSSQSGKPYIIRMADDTEVEAGPYLLEVLGKIESGPAASSGQ